MTMKTPGVYITEPNDFPNSVVSVETAIPAFIGYTQKARLNGRAVFNTPVRITSLAEFTEVFGTGPCPLFTLSETSNTNGMLIAGKRYELLPDQQSAFLLYYSIWLFYLNGGSTCYIFSTGDYSSTKAETAFHTAIDQLKNTQDITMLVIPELMLLSEQECARVQQKMIEHCSMMQNRMALLDVYGGYVLPTNNDDDVILRFRKNLPEHDLSFAAAYYPWLETSVSKPEECSFKNIKNTDLLKQLLLQDGQRTLAPAQLTQLEKLVNTLPDPPDTGLAHQALMQLSACYGNIMSNVLKQINLLPPSPAMAGIYTSVDQNRGVWKAPANISLNAVNAPSVQVDNTIQADLNVPLSGKAVNAIRSFPGVGTLVWGARTCDGNSNDWRYINVRRTILMIEQSLRLAARAFVFEPNSSSTWNTLKSMFNTFLTDLWKQGALAGSTPQDCFSVEVGLGVTMTGDDIVNGIMRVSIKLAIVRPAEFIVFTFEQQMQQMQQS